jgi:hypothetical protein
MISKRKRGIPSVEDLKKKWLMLIDYIFRPYLLKKAH